MILHLLHMSVADAVESHPRPSNWRLPSHLERLPEVRAVLRGATIRGVSGEPHLGAEQQQQQKKKKKQEEEEEEGESGDETRIVYPTASVTSDRGLFPIPMGP